MDCFGVNVNTVTRGLNMAPALEVVFLPLLFCAISHCLHLSCPHNCGLHMSILVSNSQASLFPSQHALGLGIGAHFAATRSKEKEAPPIKTQWWKRRKVWRGTEKGKKKIRGKSWKGARNKREEQVGVTRQRNESEHERRGETLKNEKERRKWFLYSCQPPGRSSLGPETPPTTVTFKNSSLLGRQSDTASLGENRGSPSKNSVQMSPS